MPNPGDTSTGPDGKLRVWQPGTNNSEFFDYAGESSGFATADDAHRADLESGQGSWVPASNVTHWPWWLKALVATGLGSAAVTGIGALAAPGAFGAGGSAAAAGTGAGASAAPGLTGGAMGGTTFGAAPAAGAGAFGGAVPSASFASGAGAAGGTAAAGALPSIPLATTLGGLPSVSIAGASGALPLSAGLPSSLAVGGSTSVPLGAAPAAGGGGAGGGGWLSAMKGNSTLSKLGGVGQVLSGYSQGAAQGREHEANLNLASDTLRQRQAESERANALDRSKLELDQRTTAQDLESQARRQAAWGDYMATGPRTITPPVNMASRVGSTIGGVTTHDSELGTQAYEAAMKRLLSGSDKTFTPPPNVPTPPLTPQPNESWLDKLARWGGTGAGIVGAANGYRPPTTGGR